MRVDRWIALAISTGLLHCGAPQDVGNATSAAQEQAHLRRGRTADATSATRCRLKPNPVIPIPDQPERRFTSILEDIPKGICRYELSSYYNSEDRKYDGKGRLVSSTSCDNVSHGNHCVTGQAKYDGRGRLVQSREAALRHRVKRSPAGIIEEESGTQTWPNWQRRWTIRATVSSDCSEVRYVASFDDAPNPFLTRLERYDPSGRIVRRENYSDGGSLAVGEDYSYYADGGIAHTRRSVAGGSTTDVSFSSDGRLLRSDEVNGTSFSGATVYDYDSAGHLLKVHSTLNSSGSTSERIREYSYSGDLLMRSSFTQNGWDDSVIDYRYQGTRIVEATERDDLGSVRSTRVFTWDSAGRLTQITETDGTGRLIGTVDLTYDAQGRLTKTAQTPDPRGAAEPLVRQFDYVCGP